MKPIINFKPLIAVAVILAVLVAILLPVFQPVHEGNHNNYCQSNLKQLGLAFIQYTQDSDEKFPSGVNAAGNGWAGQLYQYVKADGIYKCPSDTLQGNYISYAENANLVRQPINVMSNPQATVELYEMSTPDCDPSSVNPIDAVSSTGVNAPQTSKQHDASWFSNTYSLNFLAADGHVKYLPPGKVSNGANAVSPRNMSSGPYILTFGVK